MRFCKTYNLYIYIHTSTVYVIKRILYILNVLIRTYLRTIRMYVPNVHTHT